MDGINYSFIVPHRNSPNYINRLLDSIPRRDDIEIIVVDDCSDPSIIDWSSFKFNNDKCVKMVYSSICGGGGYARNLGLKIAKGEWLLFPDADDYYTDGFIEHLDSYLHTNYEVVYFSFGASTAEGNVLNWPICSYVDEALNSQRSVDWVKYKIYAVWCKMIKRSYVFDYGFLFEEVPFSNDRFFTFQIGFFTQNYKLDSYKLYNYIVYPKSVTNSSWTLKKSYARHKNLVKLNPFYELIGHPEWKNSLKTYYYDVKSTKGVKNKILFIVSGILYLPSLYKMRKGYVDKIEELKVGHLS